jgi:hypothetical protein
MFSVGLCSAQSYNSGHNYRYEIGQCIGNSTYGGEIEPGTPLTGQYYEVETDNLGRQIWVAKILNGAATSTTRYYYSGDSKLPDSAEDDTNHGEYVGTARYHYNAQGLMTGWDVFDVKGTLTAHFTEQGVCPGNVDVFYYTASGKLANHVMLSYNTAGALIKSTEYTSVSDSTRFNEGIHDANTGLLTSTIQYKGGKAYTTVKYIYAADGQLVRDEAYNTSDSSPYAQNEYSAGLLTRRLYLMAGGKQKEILYTYDGKLWLTKSELYYDSKLICRFFYERELDGLIKRTLADAPDGSVMAEYPPPVVKDVDIFGQPPGRTDGIIYKTGNWW